MMDNWEAALRKPFPADVVGKLPKPLKSDSQRGQCRECNGYHGLPAVHLDYVGHAAVTDRLLQVDPAWSWEPFALDANGLPALDSKGNLWIKLTICGVTRIGVGDGKSAKEVIGDAIRNAAMRFGVALDLWAKEDLHAADVERGTVAEPEAGAPVKMQRRPLAAVSTEPATMVTPQQLRMIGALFGDCGWSDRGDRLRAVSHIVGRAVDTSKSLTFTEASDLITVLKSCAEDANPSEALTAAVAS